MLHSRNWARLGVESGYACHKGNPQIHFCGASSNGQQLERNRSKGGDEDIQLSPFFEFIGQRVDLVLVDAAYPKIAAKTLPIVVTAANHAHLLRLPRHSGSSITSGGIGKKLDSAKLAMNRPPWCWLLRGILIR